MRWLSLMATCPDALWSKTNLMIMTRLKHKALTCVCGAHLCFSIKPPVAMSLSFVYSFIFSFVYWTFVQCACYMLRTVIDTKELILDKKNSPPSCSSQCRGRKRGKWTFGMSSDTQKVYQGRTRQNFSSISLYWAAHTPKMSQSYSSLTFPPVLLPRSPSHWIQALWHLLGLPAKLSIVSHGS